MTPGRRTSRRAAGTTVSRRTAGAPDRTANVAAPVVAAVPPGRPAASVPVERIDAAGETTLRAHRDLGVREARALLEAARGALARGVAITIDCAGVHYVDAAAAQVLIALRRAARDRGIATRVTGLDAAAGARLVAVGLGESVLD